MVALCGVGSKHSSLTVLREGIEPSELAVTDLPLGIPNGVWTISGDSGLTSTIIVSFSSSTLVLAVGDSVEEDVDSPFSSSTSRTLFATKFCDGSFLQVRQHIQTIYMCTIMDAYLLDCSCSGKAYSSKGRGFRMGPAQGPAYCCSLMQFQTGVCCPGRRRDRGASA